MFFVHLEWFLSGVTVNSNGSLLSLELPFFVFWFDTSTEAIIATQLQRAVDFRFHGSDFDIIVKAFQGWPTSISAFSFVDLATCRL